MIERTYSKRILGNAEALMRRALLDLSALEPAGEGAPMRAEVG